MTKRTRPSGSVASDTDETMLARLSRRTVLGAGAALGFALTTGSARTSAADKIKVTVDNEPPENQPEAGKAYDAMVKRYEDSHPNIDIVPSRDTWDPKTFTAKLSAGSLTDAFQVPFTEPQGIIARSQAADVTDLLKAWPNFASFNPTALAIATRPSDGHLFGYPISGYSLGLMINRGLFTKAGLNPDQPPATWEDLRAAAQAITKTGTPGFAETSTSNQGGWHFTAWMYSAGGDLIKQDASGKWQAIFNNDIGVSVLQMLKDLRFTDDSMVARQLLDQEATRQMMATGQVGMCVQAPDALPYIRETFSDADMALFGLGILPQHGGNATLSGGSVEMFSPKASAEVLAAATDFTLYRDFDLQNLEASLQADQARGALIGWPQLPIFTGDLQAQRDALFAKYSNAPSQNYQAYVNGATTIALRAEPPIETQQLYAAIDAAVQAILTDKNADPKAELDKAANQFQTQVLNQL